MEEIKCDICNKTGFKSTSGLAGHKQIEHGVKTKTVVTDKDEIGKRLNLIDNKLMVIASGIDGITKGFEGITKTKALRLFPLILSRSSEELKKEADKEMKRVANAKRNKDS